MSSQKQLLELAKEAKNFGVKVLINNASLKCPSINLEDYELNNIQKMLDVDLLAPIKLTYLLLKDINRIVNINSLVGLEVKPKRSIYSAAKYGLRGFSNSLKMESEFLHILDVYVSRLVDDDENNMEGLNTKNVSKLIYDAYIKKENELILDGRNNDYTYVD